MMAEQITYYALVDDFSSRAEPGGVIRRVEYMGGQRDEAFTSNLAWERTPLLYSAERGNLDNKFYEITEDEAMRIVERIRRDVATS
jgi:hypothetical protein